APDAPRSQPYFLRRPLAGALYDWTGVPAAWRGLPFEPPLLAATARVVIAGAPVTLSREVVYRFRDQAIGEVRRPLFVTRAFAVSLTLPRAVRPGAFQLGAAARGSDGRLSEGALVVIDYPHIRPRPVERASVAELRAARLALPGLARVGYVRGASDRVPEALE